MDHVDIVIVGAGIAGAGLAWALAPRRRVILAEAEDTPGYHTTGRSAAFFAETYGGATVQPLTTASKTFFEDPPIGFTETALVRPRGALHVFPASARDRAEAMFAAMKSVAGVHFLSQAEALDRVPGLAANRIAGAVYDTACADLDVAALHAAYLKGARSSGAEVLTSAPLKAARHGAGWMVQLGKRAVKADILVNAAGAWGDKVAEIAGVSQIGLQPKRRTIAVAETDTPSNPDAPLVLTVPENLYFKSEGHGYLISPADETNSAPTDAQPDAEDIARAVDRFERLTGQTVNRVRHKWAGLRTFAPDRAPVIGFDAQVPSFFWSVGQGGWGIQTAPAWTQLAADAILDAANTGIDPRYRPDRYAR